MTPISFLRAAPVHAFRRPEDCPVAPELQDVVFGMIVGAVRKISSYAGQDSHLMPGSST